ncbi:MAG: hypothetical protein IKU15_05785 [Clostridia bacterium]|nr:hypothetical protein [Clostridia bacterium]
MNKKIIPTIICTMVFFVISAFCWLKPATEFSNSERRPLAQKPDISISTLVTGEFMDGFEKYSVDQFPVRDKFGSLKALFSKYIFNKAENNGIFTADGHISKIEYPVNADMVNNAEDRFNYLYETYMKGKDVNIYLSLVPDKNYFIAEKNGYPSIDYDEFIEDFKNRMYYMKYIDIIPFLSIDDYYRTDSHWKQENITDVAEYIASLMGTDANAEYEIKNLEKTFEGVYLGQSALPFKPDTIKYLENKTISNCTVNYYNTGIPEKGSMYDMDKANGKDPYEIFLSGTTPLVTIENPNSKTDKELVVFRDSYGSSLVPLLAEGYKKITVVDIRYLQSNFVGNFIEFTNQDVLFIYSTTLINNSMAMR